MQNEFGIITNIIKEEFKNNSFKTILTELSKICKSKNNKNQLKIILLKIKIDIENTELKIIDKIGKFFNSFSTPFYNESMPNIYKTSTTSFTTPNSMNNSLIDKLFVKTINNINCMKNNNNIDEKKLLHISNKFKPSLYYNKFKSNCNSNENILNKKQINNINTEFKINKNHNNYKKKSNSQSALNKINVNKKFNINNNNNKSIYNKNINNKIIISHQIDFRINNIKQNNNDNNNKSTIINAINMNKEIAKDIIEFIDHMKLLQENIINKNSNIKNLKYFFEKKKNILYEKAYNIFNGKFNELTNKIELTNDNKEIYTNYFNKTIEMTKNNFQNIINNLKNEIQELNNKIKENDIKFKNDIQKENEKRENEYLNAIKNIYTSLVSLNQNNYDNDDIEINNKIGNNFNWYIEKITSILNNMNLNYYNSHKIINISNLSKENRKDEKNTKEVNSNNNSLNNSNYNDDFAAIIDESKKEEEMKKNDENAPSKSQDKIFENIIEIISSIFPVINGCIEKENELFISKLRDDYKQQGIEFILYLLKSYIKQLINIIKEYQRQSHYKDNSNSNSNLNKETNNNTNTNSSKENDNLYMHNIQKKFVIVDRNNEDPIFDDEKQNINNMNLNLNLNCSGKGIKTPNQIIKNICKEIDNRSNMDMQNKIYSMLSFIKNNLFIKIELKENETIELDNKIKQLLKINKDIKDNILSNENNIFLKKYNLLNSLFNEDQEKIQILEIEYLTLIKDFCNYIQNGEKIIIKVEKIFRKYNNNNINIKIMLSVHLNNLII